MRGRNPQPIVPHFDFESLQAPWIFQAQGQGVFGADSRNFWPSGHKKPLSFTAELSREVVHEQKSAFEFCAQECDLSLRSAGTVCAKWLRSDGRTQLLA